MKLKIIVGIFLSGFASWGVASTSAVVKTATNYVLRAAPASSPAASDTKTLTQYLQDTSAYDLPKMQIVKSTLPDEQCGDAYFLDLTVKGFWGDVQAQMDFYVQTLTQEAQDRLYNQITANYATKGLPQCLLQDQFYTGELIAFAYNYNPDVTTVKVPVNLVPVPQGYPCAGAYNRPLTSCWNVQNPYGGSTP